MFLEKEKVLIFVLVFFLLAIVIVYAILKIKILIYNIRQYVLFKKAKRLESEAATFLKKNGYKILKQQFDIKYTVRLSDKKYEIKITPDYLVKKNNKILIAEVKSGSFAPNITNKETRRQLLEYYIASKYDGILLVDMEKYKIQKVIFELEGYNKNDSKLYFIYGFVSCLVICLICFLSYYNFYSF